MISLRGYCQGASQLSTRKFRYSCNPCPAGKQTVQHFVPDTVLPGKAGGDCSELAR